MLRNSTWCIDWSNKTFETTFGHMDAKKDWAKFPSWGNWPRYQTPQTLQDIFSLQHYKFPPWLFNYGPVNNISNNISHNISHFSIRFCPYFAFPVTLWRIIQIWFQIRYTDKSDIDIQIFQICWFVMWGKLNISGMGLWKVSIKKLKNWNCP